MTSSRAPVPSRDAERPITTRRSLTGGALCWRPWTRPTLGTKMAPDDGVAAFSGFDELLFPVRETDGATLSAAILNAANRLLQSLCRLLCQMNIVAMTTTTTHSATPTATVALPWTPPSTSVVDNISVICGLPTSPCDVETSVSQA